MMEQTDNEGDDVDAHRAADLYNGRERDDTKPSRHSVAAQSSNYHSIDCLINNEYTVSCRQDGNGEVYLPFKFVSKYFEVSTLCTVLLQKSLCNLWFSV